MVEVARIKFNESKCAAIRTNAQVIYDAFESGLGCTCQHAHKSNVELNWHRDTQWAPTTFSFAFSFATVDGVDTSHWRETWKPISAQLQRIVQSQPQIVQQPAQNPATIPSTQTSESVRKKVVQFFGVGSGKEDCNSIKSTPKTSGNDRTT